MQYISCSYIQLLIIKSELKWMQVQKCSVHFDRYPLWGLCSLSLSLFIFSFTLFYHKRCQMVGDGESVWGVTTHRDKCLSNALSLFSLSFHSNSQTTGALRSVLWLLLCSYIKNVFFWYLFVLLCCIYMVYIDVCCRPTLNPHQVLYTLHPQNQERNGKNYGGFCSGFWAEQRGHNCCQKWDKSYQKQPFGGSHGHP